VRKEERSVGMAEGNMGGLKHSQTACLYISTAKTSVHHATAMDNKGGVCGV